MSETKKDSPLKFPADFWEVFNAKFTIQPLELDDVSLFHQYQLINKLDGPKHYPVMDLVEMIDFMNKEYTEYQKELERIILG